MCDFVREVWSNPNMISEVNQNDICLIPKGQYLEFISQFRSSPCVILPIRWLVR